MTPDYREGRRDGLREALALVEAMEAAETAKLDRTAPAANRGERHTRWARTIRRQAYRNAVRRLAAAVGRRERAMPHNASRLQKALDRIGL